MPRNDSFIYSGITSATNERRQAAKDSRSEKRQKKVEERGKLLPAADIVFAEIDNEKRRTYEKLAKLPLPASVSEGRVLARLEATQMHIEFLERFNTTMQNKLRTRPQAIKEDDEQDGDDD